MITPLREGDRAPDFSGLDQNGEAITASDYQGKWVVLYFYPRDNTPTCTVEACNLRDNYSELTEKGIEIIGVSDDSQRKHQNFIKKHELPFRLLADTEHVVLEKYGVWGPKKFMGREFDGTHRLTFIINKEGNIAKIIDKVRAKEHSAQILEAIGMNNL